MKKVYIQMMLALGVSLSANAQEWEWQNPYPVGNAHADVAWVDDQSFYVSGSKGQFVKTNDFGQTWETANLPTDATVREIHFVSAEKGWAATDNGEIWVTEDAGENWSLQLQDPAMPTLRDIHVLNDVGYAVGDAGYVENAMLRTTNGGSNWEAVTLPIRSGEAFYGMFYTKAINKDTVYAASWDNTFFKSYDQGVTWDTTHLPASPAGYYEGGYFVNDSTGFIVGPNGAIVKTTDFGDSWEVLAGSADSTDEDSHYFSEVFFLDEQNGWVSSFGCLYKTIDGGATWDRSCDGTYGTSRKSFIQFNEQREGIVVAGYEVYVSESGSDFNAVLPTAPINNLYSIHDLEGHLYLSASNGTIFHSQDGGENWMLMNTSTDASLKAVQFFDENNGWATGSDSTILKTSDAGLSWTSFDVDYDGSFNDMYVWSESSAIVVGSSGAIFKTTDGGATWTEGQLASTSHIYAVHFADADTGYVVGRSGLVARTVDGGLNWEVQDAGVVSHLYGVYFVDAKTGYAVGRSGKILFTEDAGATWTKQVSGQSGTLNAVYFSDNLHGWVSGSGKILVSEDGGQTWDSQDTPSGSALQDVYFNEQGNGWAVGGNGNILSFGERITSLDEAFSMDAKNNVHVFPNPANEITTFSLSGNYSGEVQLLIYDNLGGLVAKDKLSFEGGSASWNVAPSLSAGFYSYQLLVQGEAQGGKLILQK